MDQKLPEVTFVIDASWTWKCWFFFPFFYAVIVLCMVFCSRLQEAPRAWPAPPHPPLDRWGSGSRVLTSGTWSSAWSRSAPRPARYCSTRLCSSRTWSRLELHLHFSSSFGQRVNVGPSRSSKPNLSLLLLLLLFLPPSFDLQGLFLPMPHASFFVPSGKAGT